MSPLDLIRSNRDGKMSLTKCVALAAHVIMAVMFLKLQWSQPFNEMLWLIWSSVTVGHAIVDKSMAQLKSFKERQLRESVQLGQPAGPDARDHAQPKPNGSSGALS
jgi:hypothetical protein